MDWTLEAKKQIENHGLPQLDFSELQFQTVTGAINGFTDFAMTKGSHIDGRMRIDEVKTLLVWILARHKHNSSKDLNSLKEEAKNQFAHLARKHDENIQLKNELMGCSQLFNEMFKWAKVKDGKVVFSTSEETWNTYKKFINELSINEQTKID